MKQNKNANSSVFEASVGSVSPTELASAVNTKLDEKINNGTIASGSQVASLSSQLDEKANQIDLNYVLDRSNDNLSNILRVATFNIQAGNLDYLKYKDYITNNKFHIIGLQEARDDNSKLDNLKKYDIKNIEYSKSTANQCNVIQSNLNLTNTTKTILGGTGEQRTLVKSEIIFLGEKISIYCTHLTWVGQEIREAQLKEVKAIMDSDKNKYKILIADFNANNAEFYNIIYNDYKGLQGHNGIYYDTYTDSTDAYYDAIDNIVFTKNIEIKSIKLESDSMKSDHRMLWCELILKDSFVKELISIGVGTVSISKTVDGNINKCTVYGQSKYKKQDGTYTDIFSQDVNLESVGNNGRLEITSTNGTVSSVVGIDNINLVSVKTLRDKLTIENENATVTKNLKELVFYGTEDWKKAGGTFATTSKFWLPLSDCKKNGLIICDKVEGGNEIYQADKEYCYIYPNDKSISFQILTSKLSTPDVAGFKSWLAANNTKIIYELEIPIIENKGQVTIKQYKGNTAITHNGNVKGSIEVNANVEV